ncbi:MAG: hypothetical protein M3295_08745 [Chloroflexota bacterium]|nr:hypothetical protein [Chloroflexota bacterium]
MVPVLLCAGLLVTGCSHATVGAADREPAEVEPIEGTDRSRVTLTADAARRLDIQTEPVRESDDGALVVPYSAVIYDASGDTWVYTNPEPLVFTRDAISVESIDGDDVLLSSGPEVGTLVVTVGAAELYGTEGDIGH